MNATTISIPGRNRTTTDRDIRVASPRPTRADSLSRIARDLQWQANWDALFGRQADQDVLQSIINRRVSGVTLEDLRNMYTECRARTPWYFQPVAYYVTIPVSGALKWYLDSDQGRTIVQVAFDWILALPFFSGIRLRRYRRKLLQESDKLIVPFAGRTEALSLRDVFVRVKASSQGELEPWDGTRILERFDRSVVLGPPGSGKTVLVRRIAMTLCELRRSAIPVLVPLHKFDPSNHDLKTHIAATLSQSGLKLSAVRLERFLQTRRIVLLLDGLDEVPTKRRGEVVAAIRDFLAADATVPAILTCRKAVYRADLRDVLPVSVELKELEERDIRQFLKMWRTSDPNRSMDQLMATLLERPRLMWLARNPLLLTLITLFYVRGRGQLPHSRAEFFEQVSELLLETWHPNSLGALDMPRYQQLHLLAAIALKNHSGEWDGNEERTIDTIPLLATLGEELRNLSRAPEEATLVLNDFIERSGLLTELDGRERVQFVHWSFQEFFAAKALQNREAFLLERYLADPDRWREPLKFWCGLSGDATNVIREVRLRDPALSLEALSEARRVDETFVTKILGDIENALRRGDRLSEEEVGAAASLASDARERGKILRLQLLEFVDEGSKGTSEAAARILARTGLPECAGELSARIPGRHGLAPIVLGMGDLAVDGVLRIGLMGDRASLGHLRTIGSDRAHTAVPALLWSTDARVAISTAACLASQWSDPTVRAGLQRFVVQPRPVDVLDGVPASIKRAITEATLADIEREIVASLSNHISLAWECAPDDMKQLDPAIALQIVVGRQPLAYTLGPSPGRGPVSMWLQSGLGLPNEDAEDVLARADALQLCENAERLLAGDPALPGWNDGLREWKEGLDLLRPDLRAAYLVGVALHGEPGEAEWQDAKEGRESAVSFGSSIPMGLALLLLLATCAAMIAFELPLIWATLTRGTLRSAPFAVIGCSASAYSLSRLRARLSPTVFLWGPLMPLAWWAGALDMIKVRLGALREALYWQGVAMSYVVVPACMTRPDLFTWTLGITDLAIFWTLALTIYIGRRMEVRSQNPLWAAVRRWKDRVWIPPATEGDAHSPTSSVIVPAA